MDLAYVYELREEISPYLQWKKIGVSLNNKVVNSGVLDKHVQQKHVGI
jgi:hypothetical protein